MTKIDIFSFQKSIQNYKPLIGKCAKDSAPKEKDFCHEKQQTAFYNCMKAHLIQIMANVQALNWAKKNCDAMQEHLLTHRQQIDKKLKEVGEKYVNSNCGQNRRR